MHRKNVNSYVYRQWRDLLCSGAAAWTLGLVVFHQSIIAGSSFFLIRLLEVFQQGGDVRYYLACYLAAMLFPYLPGCGSYVALQVWINRAHDKYVDRLANASFGLTEKFRDRDVRVGVESVASRNSFIVIKDFLSFLHGFAGFFLNSFLSMLVLGVLLPGNLLAGYFLSVALCLGIVLGSRKWIDKLSTSTEGKFIVYSDHLSKIWANTILGNNYHFALWSDKKALLGGDYYAQSAHLQWAKQAGNLLLACASLGPTVYLVFHVLQAPSADPALLAAVIVNFTRIFHILNSLSALVYLLLDWSCMVARLRVVFVTETSLVLATNLPSLPTGEMQVNDRYVSRFDEVVELISERPSGRFTIRGENGSGKTSLLLFLKKKLGELAILIPSDHAHLMWQSEKEDLSTGQHALLRIRETLTQATVSCILLDEWDANLDNNNTHQIDLLLDEVSRTKIVVEIRH